MFNWLKKLFSHRDESKLYDASTAWFETLQTHDMRQAKPYFKNKALSKLKNIVNSTEKEYAGIDRYRHTDIEKITDTTYKRKVTYDNIKLQHGVSIPVGESFEDTWTIDDESFVTDTRVTPTRGK